MKNERLYPLLILIIISICLSFIACGPKDDLEEHPNYQDYPEDMPVQLASENNNVVQTSIVQQTGQYEIYTSGLSLTEIPEYSGEPYVDASYLITGERNTVFCDTPLFFSELDSLGRPGHVCGCLSTETMPPEGEERGDIGMIKPAGWHTVKYPNTIEDLYLYNRCHLIGWQLCSENANELNLITGTRFLNIDGMLPFENKVADYIENTGNTVIYDVTPIYVDDELLCRGLIIQAQSIEDNGIDFCIYCFNVQPGIEINYATGDSNEIVFTETKSEEDEIACYILNTNSMKIHKPDCESVEKMKDENKLKYNGTLSYLLNKGYTKCQNCFD